MLKESRKNLGEIGVNEMNKLDEPNINRLNDNLVKHKEGSQSGRGGGGGGGGGGRGDFVHRAGYKS